MFVDSEGQLGSTAEQTRTAEPQTTEERETDNWHKKGYDKDDGADQEEDTMAADATEVTERNSDKAEQAERRGRSPTRRILKRGKPRQGPTPTSNEQRTEEETRGVNKVAGRFRSDASDSIGGATMGAAQDGRKASQSPKRRERDDRRAEVGGVRKEMRKSLRSEGGTRSPSPIKNGRRPPNKGDKTAHQKYMHQYLRKALHIKAEIGMDSEEGKARTEEREGTRTDAHSSQAATLQPDVDKEQGVITTESDSEDCEYVGSTPANDAGAPLASWLELLGGTLVDVAAAGHCGWLASYAALYNVSDGLIEPSEQVTEATNALKKQVINGMVATLEEEMKLHPYQLEVELDASGIRPLTSASRAERLCALVNHYVLQRQKSVKTAVPMHYWVRPAHIKAMAIHARETIYVLDVDDQGTARAQAYAYCSTSHNGEDAFETGTNQPIPTLQAMTMLEEIVAEGILPPVLVLRWRESGNHFQAITYDRNRYNSYVQQLTTLAPIRNAILSKHGWPALDYIQYEQASIAKVATRELKAMRKAAKLEKTVWRTEDVHTVDGEDCEDEDREEGSASDDDYQAAEHETRASTGELELERAVNKETSSQIEVPAFEKVGAHPVAEDHTKLTEGRECSSADGQRDGTDEGGRAHSTDGGTH
uniref:OTU domain-containing protein n=1 Tax=Phytophthora ramorum TaxID=164328 RepID=H3GPT9_PHYRM